MEPVSPRYGIEIEVTGSESDMNNIADVLREDGVEAYAEDYSHATRQHWKVTTDSSCGLEIVSPPLTWQEGNQAIRSVAKSLRKLEQDGVVGMDARCSFHVHHEWEWRQHLSHLDAWLRNAYMIGMYLPIAETLRGVLAPSRYENTYAKLGWGSICRAERDRYSAVNVLCLERQPTVEFRQHQATLNPAKMLAWIGFTRQLCWAASLKHDLFVDDRCMGIEEVFGVQLEGRVKKMIDRMPESVWMNFESRTGRDVKQELTDRVGMVDWDGMCANGSEMSEYVRADIQSAMHELRLVGGGF